MPNRLLSVDGFDSWITSSDSAESIHIVTRGAANTLRLHSNRHNQNLLVLEVWDFEIIPRHFRTVARKITMPTRLAALVDEAAIRCERSGSGTARELWSCFSRAWGRPSASECSRCARVRGASPRHRGEVRGSSGSVGSERRGRGAAVPEIFNTDQGSQLTFAEFNRPRRKDLVDGRSRVWTTSLSNDSGGRSNTTRYRSQIGANLDIVFPLLRRSAALQCLRHGGPGSHGTSAGDWLAIERVVSWRCV